MLIYIFSQKHNNDRNKVNGKCIPKTGICKNSDTYTYTHDQHDRKEKPGNKDEENGLIFKNCTTTIMAIPNLPNIYSCCTAAAVASSRLQKTLRILSRSGGAVSGFRIHIMYACLSVRVRGLKLRGFWASSSCSLELYRA